MKRILFFAIVAAFSLITANTNAQVSVRINVGAQPIWGPVGYEHVEYYYLPDIEAYYYVPRHKYVYMEDGRWRSRSSLPVRYRGYDMYSTRKVIINEPRPYLRHNEYRERYNKPVEHYHEQPIRDSHEGRYFENRYHPEHAKWKEYKKNQREHERHEGHEGHDNGRRGH